VRGVFVTGTDTEVGKTVVACTIAASLAARGERVAAFKPAVTGLSEPLAVLPDHELLRRSAGSAQRAEAVSPYRFGPPVSPHLAAELVGIEISPGHLVAGAEAAAAGADVLVIEGVGGLLVPLSGDYLVRDFAAELAVPLVIAARPGLGTINHALMTIECARVAGLEVAAVVLTPWSRFPSAVDRSNRATIEALGGVETFGLSRVEVASGLGPARSLPAERWVDEARASDQPADQGKKIPCTMNSVFGSVLATPSLPPS
jgi:dethiobiotin synthetase